MFTEEAAGDFGKSGYEGNTTLAQEERRAKLNTGTQNE